MTQNSKNLLNVEVIIQAGGKGQRLKPLSDHQPKPLLPICGVPMIETLLRQIVASGFRNITIITGYGRDAILNYIESLQSSLPTDVRIKFHHEEKALGNVGAIGEIEIGSRRTLMLFGDLVTNISFSELVKIHLERKCMITLTSHYEKYRLRLGEITVTDNRVIAYEEKTPKEFLACSGIFVLEPNVFELARTLTIPFGISHLIQASLEKGFSVTHWEHGAFWKDVNTEQELRETEAELALIKTK